MTDASAPSPLAEAADRADVSAVAALLAAGEPPDGRPGEVDTPLYRVCASAADDAARLEVAQRLIAAGATVRRSCRDKATAAHAAARRGPVAMVELLIRHGDATWVADGAGRTALDVARAGAAPDRAQIVALLDRPVIRDPVFRQAVTAIHAGDAVALAALLDRHPNLLRDRPREPDCYAQDYFRDPKLFWFVANNPTLMTTMPATIGDVAAVMIARGIDKADLDYTLELVMTSNVAREQGHQVPLVLQLLAAGATPSRHALAITLAHHELDIVRLLLDHGVTPSASIAAAFGDVARLPALLAAALPEERQEAFGMAVINGALDTARLCLAAGADPNAGLPVHKHCTPLHTAALNDDTAMLALLLDHGADPTVRDTLWDATPLDWADHQGKTRAAAYLRSRVDSAPRQGPS